MVSINLDIVGCFKFFQEPIGFSTCPKKNKKNLEKEMEDLKSIQRDVTTIFQEQERTRPLTECKVVVKGWLARVTGIETQVKTHFDKLAKTSSGTCCYSPRVNYLLGKEAVRLIEQVHKLVEERGNFDDDNLVSPIPPDPFDNVPDLPTTMVGRDGKSSEIQGYLRDSQVTTIGILGIGGIGKTTMLKSIKQWLSGNDHDFHYIIWIEMSQNDDDILKIQKRIASCIFLSLPSEHEEWENARILDNALRRRKSLVLIDNVWKKPNFERIGIPFAVGTTDFVKILFTTRSERVCNDMRAQKIVRLNSLDEKESLQLFKRNISPDVDLTGKMIRQRVDEILKRCGGLPLVIVTVARTVANYNRVEEWNDAVKCLMSSREEIEGMDEVMKRLKFSYDKLEDDKIKSCLLYLSLHPEGYHVRTDLLIKEWAAEGFLDTPNDNSFTRSCERGVVNINKLKSICLVEKSVYSDDEVKLHDEIRHMLCWIREHENKEVFIVYNDEISDCNYDRWDLAKRIYLQEAQVRGLPETGMPSCHNLTSLIVETEYYSGNRRFFPTEDFFHFTPSLRVLDLSFTRLVDIPKSIGELVELRYLNLQSTPIHTLPMELANLKKLKCLDLGSTIKLVTIVGSAISQLSALQSLNLFNTSYEWKSHDVNMTTQHPLLKLEDLRELKNLEDLGVDVKSNSHLNTILCDEKFLKSITRISFVRIDFTTIDLGGLHLIEWISQRLPELVNLIVDGCALATDILEIIKDDQLEYVTELDLWNLEISSVTLNDACRPFRILRVLKIIGCQRLKEVSWTARIPSLEQLQVENCNSVKELVVEEEEEEVREERDYFPKLYELRIQNLENLERIHGRSPLLFPALRHLWIENCPKLKQLSFGDDSAKNMEFIKCEKIQWDSLEWENDRVQAKFSSFVARISPIHSDLIDNVRDHSTLMVGREGKSSEILGYLRDSQVTTIGILGMGGIGKTTMLKSIKQWLSGNDHDFHYIIWIQMSQNDDDIPSEHEEWENARTASALRSRKSLILIDNVWKKLEFEKIGIPFAMGTTDFVKILFTTRSERVCTDMRAQKIVRLDSLDEKESLQLFKRNISPDVELTGKMIRQRVDEILKRCGGLPLVIVTVARTVANYTRVAEWDHAVECLRSSREEIEGMDEVMKCLKFSYDELEDDKIKSCLLYLSLFPEGKQITTDELIKEWAAEGFLDTPNDNSFTRSYRRGVVNINKLKSICLVEKSVLPEDRVKLHDEIRHMLCWIREHENKEVFIVYNGEISDCNYDCWDLAKRIYLLEGQVRGLPETGMPSCHNLTSLIVEAEYYSGNRRFFPTEEFFYFTPSLRVLDLRSTGLVDIPKSIGELVELRYLNLRYTRIRTLPMELANLKKLKCLDLGDTFQLVTIVGSAISQLSALQSLDLCNTSYQWKSNDVSMTTQHSLLKLEDLRELKNLEDLGVDVKSNSHLNTILCDEKFLKSITRISFVRIDFTTIDLGGLHLIEWISQRLPELVNLMVDGCALATDILEIIKDDQLEYVTELNLWDLKISSVTLNDACRPFRILRVLKIIGCQRLKEVSWTARIPSLEYLRVENCNSVRELVVEEEEEEVREERRCFPKLSVLQIKDLENLERIHGRSPLLLPALRELFIENCPKLKQLSFGDDSAKNMEYIACEKIQWDSLEWENDRVQAKFSSFFARISPIHSDLIDNVRDVSTLMVGREGKSSEILGYLRDSQVTTIGILGMGGIGKTGDYRRVSSFP